MIGTPLYRVENQPSAYGSVSPAGVMVGAYISAFVAGRRNTSRSIASENFATSIADAVKPAAGPKCEGYAVGTLVPPDQVYPRAMFPSKAALSRPETANEDDCGLGAARARPIFETMRSCNASAKGFPAARSMTDSRSPNRLPSYRKPAPGISCDVWLRR